MTEKITVRLPVIVAPDGTWNACGWSGGSDSELMSCCWYGINAAGGRVHWVATQLEVPTTETITGTVEEATND